jgi:hypothetical protein
MPEVLLKIRARKPKEEEKVQRGPMQMEQAISTMHALKRSRGAISLEIGFLSGKISFYARADEQSSSLIESQLYAHYPGIDIERVTPALFAPAKGEIAMQSSVRLKDPEIFPIKRYTQFEDIPNRIVVDPLSTLTAALATYPKAGMRGHIALTIRPYGLRFRRRVIRFLPLLSRGLPSRSIWYANTFTRVHLTRGWHALLAFPLDMLMGGYRTWFMGDVAGFNPLGAADTLMGESPADDHIQPTSSRHDREDHLQAAKDKVNHLLFESAIAVTVIARRGDETLAKGKVEEIASGFQQFSLPHCNSFAAGEPRVIEKLQLGALHRKAQLLSTEEIATIWHLPNILVKTPNIDWIISRKLEPPLTLPTPNNTNGEDLTILGEAVFRGNRERFGIRQDDRRRHVYIIGKTGMGKSVLLQNMISSDIQTGKGIAVIDPHGDLADAVLSLVPRKRSNDVVIVNPSDTEYPISFNILECKIAEQRPLVASGLMSIFTKLWPDMWSGRMEHIMRNTLLALTEAPGTSMLGIMRMYVDQAYRKRILESVTDPLVRSFWNDEFAGWSEQYRTEAVAAIQNKAGQLLSTPLLRNILGQTTSSLEIRHAMDTGKIIIVNLSKGKLGEDTSGFLGSIFVTKFQIDAMSRADTPEEQRRDFYLYVDEFQNFATPSFANILSEARKYRLNLTMANQYLAQLETETSAESSNLKEAVFGNVGTIVAFQVGFEDAEDLAEQFGDEHMQEDILNLPKYQVYVRLLIDGVASAPFSASTLPPPASTQGPGRLEKIIALSRERYSSKRQVVEDKIRRWAASMQTVRQKQKVEAKAKEKEEEERKKAKKKGMSLEDYRKWRDREMWTNRFNQLKKKVDAGDITDEERKEMEDVRKNLEKAGGATVAPTQGEKKKGS